MANQVQSNIVIPRDRILLLLLIALGIFLRFYQLDARPVHHDEALHGMYSKYIIDNPEVQFYHYDPMLHGPLMYNAIASLFSVFGISTAILRSLNAGLGSLLLFTPLVFGRYLSRQAVIWLTAALAFSPSLIFWSRFAHHDYLVLMSYFLLAAGIFLTPRKGGIILCILSFSLQYTIKANIFVFAALLFGYLLFELLVCRLLRRRSLIRKLFGAFAERKGELACAIVLGPLVFCSLYSANFRYSQGILDGLYRKVFPYWLEQHHIQRLDGPFSFHLLVLCLYELPILLAWIIALTLSVMELPKRWMSTVFALSMLFLVVPFQLNPELYTTGFLKTYLKVKSPFDLFVCLEFALLAVLLPLHFLRTTRMGLAFFAYISLATLWTYSFLGEKVPWLTVYPQISALFFTALYFDSREVFSKGALSFESETSLMKLLSRLAAAGVVLTALCIVEGFLFSDLGALSPQMLRILGWFLAALLTAAVLEYLGISVAARWSAFGLFVGLLLYTTVITNYTRAGDKRELLSQVHTNPETHQIFQEIREKLRSQIDGENKLVLAAGVSTWPATWYFRDIPGYRFSAPQADYSSFDYIFLDENANGVEEGFDSKQFPLQSWWVPDYTKVRLRSLLSYYFSHEPWSSPGTLMMKFAVPLPEAPAMEEGIVDLSEEDAVYEEEEVKDLTEELTVKEIPAEKRTKP